MVKTAWLACGLIVTSWPTAVQAGYAEGVNDYQRGDYAAAAREFQAAAQQGDRNAAHARGLIYLTGRGVSRDNAQAIEWYRKAAVIGVGLAPPVDNVR